MGSFISEVLVKYQAFYDEFIYEKVNRKFLWKCDTALARKPIFYSGDGFLFDYSAYKDIKVTKENCEIIAGSNLEVKIWDIENISKEKAEEIMYANMEALMRCETVIEKAKKIQVIVKESKHGNSRLHGI